MILPLIILLAQQVYPPELPPIRPSVQIFFSRMAAPAQDLPAAPANQPVKVLMLGPNNIFTSQAAFTTFCTDLIAWDNLVYAHDPLNPTRVQLAACVWLAGYASINNMNTELSQMRSNTIPTVDIPSLRTQYHGDVVVLFNNDSTNCGLAYMSASLYGKDWAFSVVQKGCAKNNFSSVHERGHNFGMEHDTANASLTPAKPFAYGFCPGTVDMTRRDPMVYASPCGGSRVPYFGNPLISPFGYPFGDATHDGAQLHRWAMPIVANFYPPLAAVSVPAAPGKPTVH